MSAQLRIMVVDYLRVRRSLGYKLAGTEHLLFAFVDYLEDHDAPTITVEHAVKFAVAPSGVSPRWHALRLSAIRCFTRWAHTLDPDVQIPPARLLPARATRAAPYLYTGTEVTALLEAADELRPAIRATTFHTLLALMSATGIRTGEALGLDLTDFDAQAGTLTVTGKFGKTRMLPLHETVTTGLGDYLLVRTDHLGGAGCPALLINTAGTRLAPGMVHPTFRQLTDRAGLTRVSSACRPHLHDLRHTFAVNTMLDAYRNGGDPSVVLPVLSTWLGHAEPSDTYWYLTGTTELLAAATDRLEMARDDLDDGAGEQS
ncbi:tyrosine recombinase XerC [mine drainage metagenome]|uniref:Tyrosine recombinase XerC n=1 Tax=mine drainage metagenome TaxID=410659 RepID=A0A1J5Q605_9ZZZZ